MMKGEAFERWVETLLKDLNYTNVKRNVVYERRIDGENTRYQIDIVYGRLFKHYVECKYREEGNIRLGSVAKFKGVLDLLGKSSRRGIVATNRGFTARAQRYCDDYGIKTVGRERLESLDRRRGSLWSLITSGNEGDLEKKIAGTA